MSVQVSALPRPSTTTVRLHEPDVSYDGSPRHITVIDAEQLSVQFDSPEDALAWLAWCADHVREALRAQGGSPEPTNEDSLKAEVLEHDTTGRVLGTVAEVGKVVIKFTDGTIATIHEVRPARVGADGGPWGLCVALRPTEPVTA